MRVERFYPRDARQEDLAAYHRVVSHSRSMDLPDSAVETIDELVARLRNPFPGLGAAVHWLVRLGDGVVGFVYSRFPEEENAHIGVVDVVVHPDVRRQGIGTAVLRAVLPEVRARGRRVVEGWNVIEGTAGEKWARALGFRAVRAVAVQELTLKTADRSRWKLDAPEGYRVERWMGTAPDDLIASYAAARSAIHDAPTGETEFRAPEWTVEKVRDSEAEMREQGTQHRVVVAVREEDGEVAGLTEVLLPPHRSDECYQGDTAVLARHRGGGLGMCLKANMAEWLLADRPMLERVRTVTNSDNVHMLRINDQFGFKTMRIEFVFAQDVGYM